VRIDERELSRLRAVVERARQVADEPMPTRSAAASVSAVRSSAATYILTGSRDPSARPGVVGWID
jgi:hypothetical protein